MLGYPLSSTLLLSHSLDIQYTLDFIFFQDMTQEDFIQRAETLLHSKCHSDSCIIHAYLKDSQIQLPNSKIAHHSSSKTRFHTVGVMINNIGIKGPKMQYEDEEGK